MRKACRVPGSKNTACGPSECSYEILNLVDGRCDAADIRDAVSVIYGPVSTELVADCFGTLEAIEILTCQ